MEDLLLFTSISIAGMIYGYIFLHAISYYIVSGLAYSRLARARGMKNAWLAWVPFASSYLTGRIADDINAQYGKTTHRGVLMTVLSAIGGLCGIFVYMFTLPALLMLEPTFYGETMYFSYTQLFDNGWFVAIVVLFALGVAAIIWFIVLLFMSWYRVYQEYAPAKADFYLTIALVLYLILGAATIGPAVILVKGSKIPQCTACGFQQPINDSQFRRYE